MIKRIILTIYIIFAVSISVFSQSVIRNFMDFQNNWNAQEFYHWSEFGSLMAKSDGFYEITDEPNYVWQDIKQKLRNYYGSRSPRIGDVFEYRGQFTDRTDFWFFFRIEQVEGMNVTKWTVKRWRKFL